MFTHPTDDSIFGDTYHGVPSPLVPHQHPYPTRYHGPIFTVPRFTGRYVENPLAVDPYAGARMDRLAGMGASDRPPLLSSVTGSPIGDAVVGAALGYMIAPSGHRGLWTGIGGVTTMLMGTLGLLATGGLAYFQRRNG